MKKNGNFKRIFGAILMISAVLYGAVLPVNALSASIFGYPKEQENVVRIHVTDEELENSDFIAAFPENLVTEKNESLKNPIDYNWFAYEQIPQYFQTDYPEIMYGNETIANSGSCITSLAMVASYMTGYQYYPDELAMYFAGRGENDVARLELAAEKLNLPWEKAESWEDVSAALKEEGKIAILLMNDQSDFTDSQHFVVVSGMTEDEKLLILDPYQPHYAQKNLKQGLANGFDESVIAVGCEDAWVFDKSSMAEDIEYISRYEEDTPITRYANVKLTHGEKQLLARFVWAEALEESAEVQQAVVEVVLNRLISADYPNTIKEIIFQENAFQSVSYLHDAEFGPAQYDAIYNAIYCDENVTPENVFYFGTTAATNNVWKTIGGLIFCYAEKAE